MDALVGRDRPQTAPQMLTAPGERRIVGGGEVEAHHPEQGVQEPFGLAQREMVEEPQGQGGLDGEIRVPPLPTPPAAPAGRPGNDRFRGQPHRHIAASNEGPVVGRLVRNAVLRLIPGMNLRLHPCVGLAYTLANIWRALRIAFRYMVGHNEVATLARFVCDALSSLPRARAR